ncbi:hypothetical protein NP233_g11505 [Leucocoprinus birnbaumii]|uniref:Uncharacterized protein n=1 Tax=Leucocoprinus birnbaumii TaxID=56174 RepID=A0AAD5VHC7_9AGAR|nr:hypothetical protein NP233_g11505 [Leucocoprinus birnbaumii]
MYTRTYNRHVNIKFPLIDPLHEDPSGTTIEGAIERLKSIAQERNKLKVKAKEQYQTLTKMKKDLKLKIVIESYTDLFFPTRIPKVPKRKGKAHKTSNGQKPSLPPAGETPIVGAKEPNDSSAKDTNTVSPDALQAGATPSSLDGQASLDHSEGVASLPSNARAVTYKPQAPEDGTAPLKSSEPVSPGGDKDGEVLPPACDIAKSDPSGVGAVPSPPTSEHAPSVTEELERAKHAVDKPHPPEKSLPDMNVARGPIAPPSDLTEPALSTITSNAPTDNKSESVPAGPRVKSSKENKLGTILGAVRSIFNRKKNPKTLAICPDVLPFPCGTSSYDEPGADIFRWLDTVNRMTVDQPDPEAPEDLDRFVFCDEYEKDNVADKLAKQLDSFLKHGTTIHVNGHTLIRSEAAVLGRAMFWNCQTSLYILTTKDNNVLCPYHKEINKDGVAYDGGPPAKRKWLLFSGCPFQRNALKGRATEQRQPGHLHCGCIEDHVLLEQMLRKVMILKSPVTDVTESMQQEYLLPRDRAFFAQVFFDWTGLTVNDLFRDKGNGEARTYGELLKRQIEALNIRLEAWEGTYGAA